MIQPERIYKIKSGISADGPVIYRMSRDQRVFDNHALLFAQEKALEMKRPLIVLFCLADNFHGAGKRQFGFMLRGLSDIKKRLGELNIPFVIRQGNPGIEAAEFVNEIKACTLITDFDPLKIKSKWNKETAGLINIPFFEVDTHNVIPCRHVSNKTEFAAYTIRPKIHKQLAEFLAEPGTPEKHPFAMETDFPGGETEPLDLINNYQGGPDEVEGVVSGEYAAHKRLNFFMENILPQYAEKRNDPNEDMVSGLSAYLHFGQISALRIALELMKNYPDDENRKAFLEELIVRKELADNFCFYNPDYDNFNGFHDWAKKTLNEHRDDRREYLYKIDILENGQTHDGLWNAAQKQMLREGRMQGWLRMYWAKKILEWTESPEQAMEYAIRLNDTYQLDGRDPNGYAGIAWSIGGVHDRAWQERPVFGKVRYMNYNGAKRKFDVNGFVKKYN